MDLERILKRFFDVSAIFNNKGDLTRLGKIAYNDLITTLYDLETIGVLDSNVVSEAIDKLDKMVSSKDR